MRILVTGASGNLGTYVLLALARAGGEVIAWSGREPGERFGIKLDPVDLNDPDRTGEALDRVDPSAVLHLAAVASMAAARKDPERAHRVNVVSTRVIADWCRSRGRRLLFTSTDLVFDGTKPWYREADPVTPVSVYGRTKAEAEREVIANGGLVCRMPLMFGPALCGRPAFFDHAISAIRGGESRVFFEDEYRTPLDYPTAAEILVRLLHSEAVETVHIGGEERVSRFDLMRRIVAAMGLDAAHVRANRLANAPAPEPRSADTSMETTRLVSLLPGLKRPTIEEAALSFLDLMQ